MSNLNQLFKNNHDWATSVSTNDPGFFKRLAEQQTPQFLWIGCSDSRVPATQIVGLPPGELFVHRNIANVIRADDVNCQSVVQFAVKSLKVRHIVVCGHYGCGGVQAAMQRQNLDLVDQWVDNIRDLYTAKKAELDQLDKATAHAKMCELNVLQQVTNLCQTTTLRDAWEAGQKLTVHGCIYSVEDGLLRDLEANVSKVADLINIPM